ncbi:MAG TPA: hypothetical protein VF183_00015 [Acidimicrobiales bacterium]
MTSWAGLRRLVRFTLRRDRVRVPLWVGGLSSLLVVSAASVVSLYPDEASIQQYVDLFGDNPALTAFAGPGYGFDDPNRGVVLVNETMLFGCIGTALMNIFLVNRHTRAEEDRERAELIRSTVVGPHAPSAAALAVIAAANVVVGVLSSAGFVALGYATAGSIALGAAMAAVGLVFAGITAVAAQVASSGRATLGAGATVLVATFTLRAVGDITDNWLSWLSPLGWGLKARPFAGERWWTLGLCLVVALALVVVAFWLSTRRDLGSGIVPPRRGAAHAARWITTPIGLAFRLQRGTLAAWVVGLFAVGVAYGSIREDIDDMLEDNPEYADFLAQFEGASLTDSYFATAMVMLAIIAAGFAISSTLQLRAEESGGRAEPILAGPISRPRWAAAHLAIAVTGTVATIAAAGLGVGVSYAVVVGDAEQVPRMVGAALVTVPAVLVLVGVATLLFGLVPGQSLGAWAALALVAVVSFLGEVLRLPRWARQVSPLEHVPQLPARDLDVVPLVVLTVIAGAFIAVGLRGFRARDLRTA